MYISMPKGTSQDEVMLNSEKIKHVALAIVELCWSEGIRQAGRWADGRRARRQADRQTDRQTDSQSVENYVE